MKDILSADFQLNTDLNPQNLLHGPLSPEQIQAVHDATIEVLSKTGFRFVCESVRNVFKNNGFRVEDGKVYFTEDQLYRALETVPERFIIRGRNPKRDINMEPGTQSIGMGRGAIHIVEPDGSYRSATTEDVVNSLKLSQYLDAVEHIGPLSYPFDIDWRNIHLWSTQAAIKYTDKAYNYAGRHDIDLNALGYGTTRHQLMERSDKTASPGQATAVVQSPLTVTQDDCQNMFEYARCGIAYHVASMPVAGTSGPCTIAGTIVLQNAENLGPIVFSQLVSPGTPVFYGAIAGHADMMSLRPRFGTPEARIFERAGNQMARFYGLLCRGNVGLTDAPADDFQAGAQAMVNTLAVLQDGPNFLSCVGLLGSYLGASLAKIMLDIEIVTLARRYLSPFRTDREALAPDVIAAVGPGGHFIEHEHTLENYRNEFLTESLFRSPDYEKWKAAGKKVVVHLAREKALSLIEEYERPPIDPGLEEEVDRYVAANWYGA